MNRQESDILHLLLLEPYINQRVLADTSGHSLGIVNRSLKTLIADGYLDENLKPTAKATKTFQEKAPKNAIILAAGFGMRMVPINMEMPKGLIEVNGEPLIERIIKQLHEVGITEIHVVVGFMKEQYEYLIDDFGVNLIVNPEYATKNNLHSMYRALKHLSNTYVIPCDIWCEHNPFSRHELYSWYMVSDLVDNESTVRINRKMELVTVPKAAGGNTMVGICYLLENDAAPVREKIGLLCKNPRYDEAFWEEALYQKDRMTISAKVVPSASVVEINTYEQLRDLDNNSRQLQSDALNTIRKALNVPIEEIKDITVLKKGMTNRSFLFTCKDQTYIMRIPGEGSDLLVNRKQEADVYHLIADKHLCDDLIFVDPVTGYKLTKYLANARVCDPSNVTDLSKCMQKLRQFHALKLKVDHEFNIFKEMDFYESLWNGEPSAYRDYRQTKENVLSLRPFIEAHAGEKFLTHIDPNPDNFLFSTDPDGNEDIRLIDWEYAGMQDQHADIAMFCIYSLYDKEQTDQLIDLYFTEGCSDIIRIKIYCYISVCGLLWSNWCEYKRMLGFDFGEFSLRQYRCAKDFYRIVQKELKKLEENKDV